MSDATSGPHARYSLTPEQTRAWAGTHSAKWSRYASDVLPLWVADMDFPPAPALVQALQQRLEGWLGYPPFAGHPPLVEALLAYLARRGWVGAGASKLAAENLMFVAGVVPGLYASVLAFSSPGEEVIVQTPIYPPFLSAITDAGRVVKHNPLRQVGNSWQIDFEQLESLVTPATRLLMLCSPHNPTGRVWSRPELQQLADFALKHRLYVVSDELHSDLVFEGEAIAFASLGQEIAQRTVVITGPCKTYNTAGLGIGLVASENKALLERIAKVSKGIMGHANSLSMAMWQAALTEGGDWLQETLAVLRDNRDFLGTWLAEHLPLVVYIAPEGTYLAWLDFNAYPCAATAFQTILDEAKVALNNGPDYDPMAGQGWLRLNFATSRPVLRSALERIKAVVAC
jgi:cysteine-S-conjugate beta-lyase